MICISLIPVYVTMASTKCCATVMFSPILVPDCQCSFWIGWKSCMSTTCMQCSICQKNSGWVADWRAPKVRGSRRRRGGGLGNEHSLGHREALAEGKCNIFFAEADPQTKIFGHQWGSSSSSGGGLNPHNPSPLQQIEHYMHDKCMWLLSVVYINK